MVFLVMFHVYISVQARLVKIIRVFPITQHSLGQPYVSECMQGVAGGVIQNTRRRYEGLGKVPGEQTVRPADGCAVGRR